MEHILLGRKSEIVFAMDRVSSLRKDAVIKMDKGRLHLGYGLSGRGHARWLYLFLGGFLPGVIAVNLGFLGIMEDSGLLDAAALNRLKYLDVDNKALFSYVFRERMGTFVILVILATTFVGAGAACLYMIWLGFLAGIILSASAIRYGIRGVLLMAAGIFPHYLLFVPAVVLLLEWCCQFSAGLYSPGRERGKELGTKKQYYARKIVSLLLIAGVVITGCILESYVNPPLLTGVLKIF